MPQQKQNCSTVKTKLVKSTDSMANNCIRSPRLLITGYIKSVMSCDGISID